MLALKLLRQPSAAAHAVYSHAPHRWDVLMGRRSGELPDQADMAATAAEREKSDASATTRFVVVWQAGH